MEFFTLKLLSIFFQKENHRATHVTPTCCHLSGTPSLRLREQARVLVSAPPSSLVSLLLPVFSPLFHYGDRASGSYVTWDSTHLRESWFFLPTSIWLTLQVFIFSFHFLFFLLRSISVVIFFFSNFSFYLLYVWSFLDNFYMKIVLKNYTKTCA